MTADQLRFIASQIEAGDSFYIDHAATYLRACADALDAGPVAWREEVRGTGNHPTIAATGWRYYGLAGSQKEAEAHVRRCTDGIEGRSVPLYPVAMPVATENTSAGNVAETAKREHDPLHLSRILHELAGSASLCWNPRPTGVFDSERAIGFVEAAIADIRSRMPALRMPEPMTDTELLVHLSLNPPALSLWQHIKEDSVIEHVQRSVLAIARAIEAETLRRVKEANE